jgi:hypothetical protein
MFLLIDTLGFRATAAAEVFAWVGALIINAAAFAVIFIREKNRTENKELHKHALSAVQQGSA